MANIKVIWSDEALSSFEKIVDYVFNEWGIHPVLDLQYEIERLVIAIRNNGKLCPDSKIIGLRKCVLSKHTSLVYRITHSHLEIVTFLDNRSEHLY